MARNIVPQFCPPGPYPPPGLKRRNKKEQEKSRENKRAQEKTRENKRKQEKQE